MKNNFTGEIFLAAATERHIILLQWVESMKRFMIAKQVDIQIAESDPFRLIVHQSNDQPYPSALIGVQQGPQTSQFPLQVSFFPLQEETKIIREISVFR